MVDHNTNADGGNDQETTTIEVLYTRGAATRDDPALERGTRIADVTRALSATGSDALEELDVTAAEAIAGAYVSIGRVEYLRLRSMAPIDEARKAYERCQGPNEWGDVYNGADVRSMGVGDVVAIDGSRYFMVEPFGFTELDVELDAEGDASDEDDDQDGDGEDAAHDSHAAALAAQLREAEEETLEEIGADEDDQELATDGGRREEPGANPRRAVEHALEILHTEDPASREARAAGHLRDALEALDDQEDAEDESRPVDLPRTAEGIVSDALDDESDDGARYEAVDPVDLEPGEYVIVEDVAGDLSAEGEVLEIKNEAGRIGVVLEREDGREATAWEETGRTYTRRVDGDESGDVDAAATISDLVPTDLEERQREAFGASEDADLWATDAPVCLSCGAANLSAYGGGKDVVTVDGWELVADKCAECDQSTVQVRREA